MKPVIGLTACREEDRIYKTNDTYVHAVLRAGGIPLLLPIALSPAECAGLVDGYLFPGGIDTAPQYYGQEPLAQVTEMDRRLDDFELEMLRLLEEQGKPVLAICRGCQLLNVAFGGTLFQDIPTQCQTAGGHYQHTVSRSQPYHTVEVEQGTLLAQVLGERRLLVNSFHHQAIREVAEGFRVSARAADGIVEGIERCSGAPMLGVQWHPECMEERYPVFRGLFSWLTQEAARRRDERGAFQ